MTKPQRAIRIGLIVLMAGGVLAFAAFETGAISRLSGIWRSLAPRDADVHVPALEGSKLLRSYHATFNGRDSQFAHYASRLGPRAVIEAYKQIASQPGRSLQSRLPGAQSVAKGQAMISYRDTDGSTVGVVAFGDDSGGSVYFVGRTDAQRASIRPGLDVPGREPPDVPKPLRSVRVMCVENLAGLT